MENLDFKEGQVCVLVSCDYQPRWIGREVIITKEFGKREMRTPRGPRVIEGYSFSLENDMSTDGHAMQYVATPGMLQALPDRNTPSKWEALKDIFVPDFGEEA